MTIGSFCLIKNEKAFLRAHLDGWLPYLDEMVFFDGNSTDGSLETLREYGREHKLGFKLKIFAGKDPVNLKEAYVPMFNSALWTVQSDFAFYLHPDMIVVGIGNLRNIPKDDIAASINVKSYAGDSGGNLFEIVKGRRSRWKAIHRLRNPDLGAHYHGFYGAADEDVYFSEITGDVHSCLGDENFEDCPYTVYDTGALVYHYSDVRPYERRLQKMKRSLLHQGYSPEEAAKVSPLHPRVSLKNGSGFEFKPAERPAFLGGKNVDFCHTGVQTESRDIQEVP